MPEINFNYITNKFSNIYKYYVILITYLTAPWNKFWVYQYKFIQLNFILIKKIIYLLWYARTKRVQKYNFKCINSCPSYHGNDFFTVICHVNLAGKCTIHTVNACSYYRKMNRQFEQKLQTISMIDLSCYSGDF